MLTFTDCCRAVPLRLCDGSNRNQKPTKIAAATATAMPTVAGDVFGLFDGNSGFSKVSCMKRFTPPGVAIRLTSQRQPVSQGLRQPCCPHAFLDLFNVVRYAPEFDSIVL